MTTYDLPTDVSTLTQVFAWANSTVDNIPVKLFLLSFWAIATTWFIATGKDAQAVVVSTGMTLILAMFFQIGGLIELPFILFLLGVFSLIIIGTWVVGR